MGGEFQSLQLGTVCSKIGSGATPRGGKEAYRGGSTSLIRSQNIYNDRFVHDGLAFIDDDQADQLRNVVVEDGDVLLNITGDSVARCCQVDPAVLPARVNQHVAIIRPKAEILDARFLRYSLVSPTMQARLLALASAGATRNALTKGMLEALDIAAPLLPEQHAIAHILGTLDDKIELNRRRNQTLEAMARALFKDWFVDFGPVRAKMEGQESYLPADLWQLFPDRLDDEGKPEGWELRPVDDFAELKGGKQLDKDRITTSGPVPVFGGAGVMGYTEDHNADGFVIVVGRVGAYCGQFFSYRGKAWVNNNASLIRQIDDVLGEWLFLSLRNADIDVIKKGAAQPFVSNGDIAKLPLVWPGHEFASNFSKIVVPLIRRKERNEAESETLAKLRDTFLPKLISGELRIADAETFMERAECQAASQTGSAS